ncbi:hypothetical protein K7432_007253 [Basidiobolus ranarum]|uniref:Uncharacterized protein n=1 Tax=Basidiobolus ranarum TaxID=34480 RepID=A0ABR2WTV6_9FUNG
MTSFATCDTQETSENSLPKYTLKEDFIRKTPFRRRVNSCRERPKSCPTFNRKIPKQFEDPQQPSKKTREKQKSRWESTKPKKENKEDESSNFKRKPSSKDKYSCRKVAPIRLSQGVISYGYQLYLVYNGLYILIRSCNFSLQLQSFVHLVFALTTIYHLCFLFGSFVSPRLLRLVVLNGTHFINSSLWLCVWIVPSIYKPSAFIETYGLSGNEEKLALLGFSRYGNWTTIWMPIIHWCIFLFLQRNLMSIIFWEHDGNLNTRQLLQYRGFNATSSLLVILIWEGIRPFYLESKNFLLIQGLISFDFKTDISQFPGFFTPSVVSIGAGFALFWWYNFMSFQYAGIAWQKPFRRGTLFFYDRRKLVFSEVY